MTPEEKDMILVRDQEIADLKVEIAILKDELDIHGDHKVDQEQIQKLRQVAQPSPEEKYFKDKVLEIMRNEITFSGQLHNFVIHGALESIWKLHQSKLSYQSSEIERLTRELDKVKDIPSRVLNNGDKLI